MKISNKKYNILVLILCLAIIAALAALAATSVKDARKQAQIKSNQTTITLLKKQLDNYNRLFKADEEFLRGGQTDSALLVYTKLLPELDEPTANLVKQRLAIVNTKASQVSITDEASEHEYEIARLRKNIDSLVAQNLLLRKNQEKSAQLVTRKDSAQIKPVKQATAPDEKQNVQVISFKNDAGKTIHYLGEVANGKAYGGGVGIWSTGSIYRGSWRENMRHGRGEFEWADGVKYVGQYREDKRNGEGIYYWPSGERYEGGWKNDIRDGYGVLYDMDGNIKYKGSWRDDKPVSN